MTEFLVFEKDHRKILFPSRYLDGESPLNDDNVAIGILKNSR